MRRRRTDKMFRFVDQSAKQVIAQKAEAAAKEIEKKADPKQKESWWIVRKLRELKQKVMQPHVLKAAAAALISSAVSAAVVALKSRIKARQQLIKEQEAHDKQVESLQDLMHDKERELRKAKMDYEELSRANSHLNTRVTAQQDRLEEINEQRIRVMSELRNANQQLDTVNQQLHEANQRVNLENARANEANARANEANERASTLQRQLGNIRANNEENEQIRRRIRLAEEQRDRLQAQFENLQDQVSRNTVEGHNLIEARNRVRAEIDRTYEQLRENERIYQRRHMIVAELETEIGALSNNLREEVQRVLNIHQRAVQTQQEIAAYNQTIQTLNPEGERISRDIANRTPVQVPGAINSSFSEAGRYHGIANEAGGANARNANFSETSNRFSSIAWRNSSSGNVNRPAFQRLRTLTSLGLHRQNNQKLLEEALSNNTYKRPNVFGEKNARYSSLELDSAYNLWLSQFD